MTTGVRRQASGGGTTLTTFGARVAPTSRGRAQAEVLAAIGTYAKAHSIPSLDRGLRSILAQQVSNLLTGGWKLEEIKRTALDLFAKYDRFNGHRLMTQLQRTMEVADEQAQEAAHNAQKHIGLSADAIKALGYSDRDAARLATDAQKLLHPNLHDYASDGSGSCSVCRGPQGVHVRRAVEMS